MSKLSFWLERAGLENSPLPQARKVENSPPADGYDAPKREGLAELLVIRVFPPKRLDPLLVAEPPKFPNKPLPAELALLPKREPWGVGA